MDIVEELRRDRESGAKRLVSEYKAGLLSLARRFYKNECDAEELVNATFAKVVANIDDYLEQSAFFAWMCQILTNEFRDNVRRKSNKTEIYTGVMPEMVDENAQEAIYANLDASLLRDAIETLPEDIRKTLLLHYFMDMPVKEVARVLSSPTSTITWRLHYARRILAAKLGVAVDKAKTAASKPGGKALLGALALACIAALGAATSFTIGRLISPSQDALEQQADNSKGAVISEQEADNSKGDLEQQADNSKTWDLTATGNFQGEQQMKATTRSFLAASAAIAAATVAPRTASASMDTWQGNATTPVVQLIVDADMTLSQALTANNASLSGAASLIKLGNGTVTVDDESGIGSFAGDIHVFAGGWSVGTAAGFGTSAGATWVYPNGCVLVTDVTVSHAGETFHLAGTGKSDWYGWGAIRFPESSQESSVMAAGAYGSRWILEGDATVMLSTSGGHQTAFLPAIDLELNGHELTLWRGHYGTIATTKHYGNFNSVTGAGGIVCKNGVRFVDYCFTMPGGSSANYVGLQNASLRVWESSAMNTPWGLVARPTALADWHGNATTQGALMPRLTLLSWGNRDRAGEHGFQIWPGPVTLDGDLWIEMENQNRANPITFTNKVTGAGGLAVTTGKAWLYLDCPENDFQGGVTLAGPNNRLVLANDGALPANGGPLKITDSTVSFPSSVSAPWSLPDLEIAGASSVGNCQGSWKTVTVLEDADASYSSALGASNLIIKAGATLTVNSLFDPASYAGWEERYDLDHSTTDITALPYVATKLSPEYFENDNFKWLADSNGATKTGTRTIAYSTYAWNNESTNVTWTFAGHFGSHVYAWLDDQLILSITAGNAWRNPYRITTTLHPGANKLVVLSDNNSWGATSDTNSGNDIGTWAGVKTKGFVYAVGDVPLDNCSDFTAPTDPGDGSLFTTKSGDSTIDGIAWAPTFQNIAMEADSTLDVNGGSLSVETVKGAGNVDNGDLTVTRALEIDPTVFANNGGIAVDGDLVFDNGAKISFPDSDSYRDNPAGFYTLATATGSITGFDPSMLELGGARQCWNVSLSGDGKTLSLELVPPATTIIFR